MFKTINGGLMPQRGSKYAACVDLYANEDIVIGAGETKLVGLGVCIELDFNAVSEKFNIYTGYQHKKAIDIFLKSHYLQLMLRSSLGKKGLVIPNGVGVIDMDYADEIKVMIHNPIGGNDFYIVRGERVVQCALLEHKSYLFDIDTDNQRDGGFGSTGR